MTWDDDAPTVCVAHGRFVPCRKSGEHRETQSPYWVKAVRDYQGSEIPGLTWEPAWPRDGYRDGRVPMIYRRTPRIVAQACIGCRLSLNACQAGREYQREACCPSCRHE